MACPPPGDPNIIMDSSNDSNYLIAYFTDRRQEVVAAEWLDPQAVSLRVGAVYFEGLCRRFFADGESCRFAVEGHCNPPQPQPGRVQRLEYVRVRVCGQKRAHTRDFPAADLAARQVSRQLMALRANGLGEQETLYYAVLPAAQGSAAAGRDEVAIELDEPPSTIALPQRPTPGRLPRGAREHLGPAGGEYPVCLSTSALTAMMADARSDLERERGGWLLGGLHRDIETATLFAHIRDWVPVETTDASLTHLAFSGTAWERLYEQLRERQLDRTAVLGYWHSHPFILDCPEHGKECPHRPRSGLFFSEDDVFVMHASFAQPYQLGLVVAPLEPDDHRAVAAFGWRDGRIEERGLWLV